MSLFWKSNGSFHQFNQGPQPKQPPIQNWQVSHWEPEIDNLFEAAAKELDERKRKKIYAEFQQVVADCRCFYWSIRYILKRCEL